MLFSEFVSRIVKTFSNAIAVDRLLLKLSEAEPMPVFFKAARNRLGLLPDNLLRPPRLVQHRYQTTYAAQSSGRVLGAKRRPSSLYELPIPAHSSDGLVSEKRPAELLRIFACHVCQFVYKRFNYTPTV